MSSTPNVYTCDAVTPTCLLQYSIYGYFPSLPANAFFLSLFIVLLIAQQVYGPQYSYLKPKYYTWLFIGGDCVSLSLQAAGGGLSGGANGNTNQLNLGSNIAIAGIIMQVVTLAIFAALAGVFFLRRHLAQRKGLSEKEETPVIPQLQTMRFKLFAGAVIIAFLAIFTRCVYRIAEMMGGWGNPLMQDQTEFIALDSVMCSVAAVALTVFHPGYCFPQMAQPISFGKKRLLNTFEDSVPADSASRVSSSSLSSEVDLEKLRIATTGKSCFRLDVVVVSSGSGFKGQGVSDVTDTDPEEWKRCFDVNTVGTYNAAYHLVPLLLQTPGGARAFVAISTFGLWWTTGPPVKTSGYLISKLVQLRLVELMAQQYQEEGLLSVGVHPGTVATEMTKALPADFLRLHADGVELCGSFCVWLTRDAREKMWLSGRWVSATWDTEELTAKRDGILEKDLLKAQIALS